MPESLEKIIAYKFANSLLLAEALTHPSLAYETQRPHFDNQRLEYLGDAVLQLILTDELYRRFPSFSEGRLTKIRSRLVSKDALWAFARQIKLFNFLLLGKGEESTGGKERASNLADAYEALIGAIYIDGGFDNAKSFVLSQCQHSIEQAADEPDEANPKGRLQELLQSISQNSPNYRILQQGGPDHAKTFESCVEWEGTKLGSGWGCSKKEAEFVAANEALKNKLWIKIANDL
ncbi:MAG: ribonuclease III [Verrucomicrobiales bacterium]|nr:ribonuclease III [Verrucomicrobiales bacterium]